MSARLLFRLALVLGLGLASPGCGRKGAVVSSNPLVITPQLALESFPKPRSLYYNASAWRWLREKRPDLLPEEERAENSPKAQSLRQAVQNAKMFRQLDRQYRFDTLLLVGAPSEYRPLLEHLLETPDWKLAYLDHTSLVFHRGGTPEWTPAAVAAVKARLSSLSPPELALCLAQMAGKLVAVREQGAARELLESAERTESAVPEVWSNWGEYRMAQGDWTSAIAAADRALKIDPGCLPAIGVKAQCLYAKKRFSQALSYSAQLVAKLPDDPNILFYHAKIAHEAQHFSEEIRTMQHLIALAEASGRVDPGYHVYLGQAYAKQGDAEPALEELRRALMDDELPPEQRKYAEETLLLIQQKTGHR